ncbi:ribosomal protein S5 domain 2-type protein [Lasiosphaeria miniovina]|uniref:Ribosomal RNA-processing protein 43 n=1 Tax=Lasiosphaeria miniovina TaxID=1954250 RepID=A0AA40AJT3_9PEZI|nr:ribosomal protein S5 domain 2-type protein [Lasiosphaeria miniovina]KAK0717159.1 ribosomal protein S5 domain 2-type protein [Lasiosphaeria miniovina]
MAAPSMSFPRAVFAKLSPHPYLLRTLAPQPPSDAAASRTNGRAPHEARPVHIHTSSLSHAHGSALVRTGDTTVICGVRGEVLPVANIPQYRPQATQQQQQDDSHERADERGGLGRGELKDYDLLVPNIELATGCAPQFLPGVPPTTLAQTLSTRVYSLLHSCRVVDPKSLRIWYTPPTAVGDEMDTEEQQRQQEEADDGDDGPQLAAYWVLYIDLLFVSLDGNPFDAAWTAVMAALRDTKLPAVRWDPDRQAAVLQSYSQPTTTTTATAAAAVPGQDKNSVKTTPLPVAGLPVACTAAMFPEKEHGGESMAASAEATVGNRHWILLDPDRSEETLCSETITMVVDCSEGGETRIKSIEKQGGVVIGRELIRGFAGVAEKRWKEVRDAMQ